MNNKLKIKKGDLVAIITGSDKGKKGSVIKVFPSESKLIVSGVNLVKKHVKPSKSSEGGITTKEAPIHISNVSLLDPESGAPVKVRYVIKENSKIRVSKLSGQEIKSAGV
jgi:large subunit ribosomal protein L24